MAYTLAVSFKSNERPWSTIYDKGRYTPTTDEEAIQWAVGMAAQLEDYTVTLLKDGKPMSIPTGEREET